MKMTKTKRLLILIALAVVLCAIGATTAMADDSFQYSYSPVGGQTTVAPGGTISYTVSVTNNPGIFQGDIWFTYDQNNLEVLDPTPGTLAGTAEITIMENTGVTFGKDNSWTSGITDDGELLTLNFKVKEDTDLGDYTIGITSDYYDSVWNNSAGPSSSISFTVENPSYAISASAGANGSISPSGTTNVDEGGSQAYTITPDSGYAIADITVDGTSVLSGCTIAENGSTSYTFSDVTAAHTIAASFVTAPTGTLSPVYLDGTSGSDENDGATAATAVATFAKAKELLAKDGIIYITGTVTVTSDETWSLPANLYGTAEVMRGFVGIMVKITAGTLTLENIVLDGNSASFSGSSNYFLQVYAPTGGTAYLIMNNGAVIQNNSNSSTCGGVHVNRGVFTMNGGVIANNITGSSGNGVYISSNGTFIMNGGTIKDNTYSGSSTNIAYDSQIYTSSSTKTVIGPNADVEGKFYMNRVSPYLAVTGSLVNNLTIAINANYINEGVIVAQGEGSYVLTESDRQKMSFTGVTGVYLALDSNQIYITATNPDAVYYDITAGSGTGGNISPSGIAAVDVGKSQTYIITPDSGYVIADVTIDGASGYGNCIINEDGVGAYTFSNVAAAHTISVNFAENTGYGITVTANAGGSINPTGRTQVAEGGSQDYTMVPADGYEIYDVTVDGVSALADCVIDENGAGTYAFSNVTDTHTLQVIFALKTGYGITISSVGSGTVSPASFVRVAENGNQTFTFTPDDLSCYISDVTLDGESVLNNCTIGADGVGAYTLSNVTANHVLAVTFVAKSKLSTVYLDGVNGLDTNDGATAATAVKTFAAAKALLLMDGTIYMTNMVTVTSDEIWSLPADTYGTAQVMRGFYGNVAENMINITNGTLTLEDIVIDGNQAVYRCNSTQNIININGSTSLTAGLVMNEGACLQNNYNKVGFAGAVYVQKGTFTMNGGTISNNLSISSGAGIYISNGSFIMNGGTIKDNITTKSVELNIIGGNIYVGFDANIEGPIKVSCLYVKNSLNNDFYLTSGTSSPTEGTVYARGVGYVLTKADKAKLNWSGTGTWYFGLDTANNTIYVTATPQYIIDAVAGANGSISPSGSTGVASGNSQTYTVTPDEGYVISDILVDGVSALGSCTIGENGVATYTFDNVAADHLISVSFAEKLGYSITASYGTGGSVSPSGITQVAEDGSQTFIITPATDYFISDVMVDGSSIGPVSSYTFDNVVGNHTIAAAFALVQTSDKDLVDFYVGMDTKLSTLPEGQTVTITNNSANEITLAEPTGGNYFTASLSDTTIQAGGTVTLTLTPNEATLIDSSTGYLLSEYSTFANLPKTLTDTIIISSIDGSSSIPLTVNFNIKRAKTFTVVCPEHGRFKLNLYSADIVDEQGRLVEHPNYWVYVEGGEELTTLAYMQGTQYNGDSVKVNYEPDEGYKKGSVIVYSDQYPDGLDITSGTYGCPLGNDNERLITTFVKQTFAITATAGEGGSITESGVVEYGDDKTFTITPDAGYHIDAVAVDGIVANVTIDSDTDIGTYTFTDVTTSHTIEVEFAANDYTTLGDVNGDGDITIVDALRVCKAINKVITLTDDQKIAADVNHDGDITIVDALRICKYVNKVISEF